MFHNQNIFALKKISYISECTNPYKARIWAMNNEYIWGPGVNILANKGQCVWGKKFPDFIKGKENLGNRF